MEDKSKKNIKTILRLFPYLNDKKKAEKLKIDDDSIYYISIREHADKISKIIHNELLKLHLDPKQCVITDATAGVGGNTISFAKNFREVNSIEIEEKRFNYLVNNVNLYELDNVNFYNEDCTKILPCIDNHDVVYVDPPWGGKSYKNHEFLKLQISQVSIEMMCNHILDYKIMKKVPVMIVLKLPNNYDIHYLYKTIKSKTIYFYNLEKMYILVIINDNFKKV